MRWRPDAGSAQKETALPPVEWVRVDGHVVIATDRRRWLETAGQPALAGAFAGPMTGPGTTASTGNLLDGVLTAAAQAVPTRGAPPSITELRWAWRLVGAYATTSVTPRLMAEAAQRLAGEGREQLAAHCRTVAHEEEGHDRLALRDLEALGYDAPAVVGNVVHPVADALVAYFESLVRGPHPVTCLGYAYALERRASAVPREYVEAVERALPGLHATRCLRVHSSLGSDARHVANALALLAGLPADDRGRVAVACYDTAVLLCSPPHAAYLDERALAHLLSPYRSNAKGASWPET